MSLYLTRAKYSQEAFKGMIANPSDREAAGKAMFEAAGIKVVYEPQEIGALLKAKL